MPTFVLHYTNQYGYLSYIYIYIYIVQLFTLCNEYFIFRPSLYKRIDIRIELIERLIKPVNRIAIIRCEIESGIRFVNKHKHIDSI